MPAVKAPAPQEPNPVEFANWAQGRSNARAQYANTLASTNYGKAQAGLANTMAQSRIGSQFKQNRQTVDDPYIGRGIFNSGIRNQGLTNLYDQRDQAAADAQQQYLAAFGGYDVQLGNAYNTMDTSLNNIREAELARRAALAAEINGIK